MTTDETLIRRFGPVLRAGIRAGTTVDEDCASVHAEVMHQLCLADGLLELLDWTRQGLGADPLACLWLGSLRWHRLLVGRFPEGAPEPPSRAVDSGLEDLLRGRRPRFWTDPETGETSRAGLASGEMAYPGAPAQPRLADPIGLVRLVPLALVPYVEESMRAGWTGQALSLTQGHPQLHSDARRLISLVHGLAAEASPGQDLVERSTAQARQIMGGADDVAVAVVLAQVRAAAGCEVDDGHPPSDLETLVETSLVTPWREITAPA